MKKKKCQTCGKEKSLTDFYYRKDSGRYRPDCKNCHNKKQKRTGKVWRKKNKEYHKQYYIKNKEIILKKNKKWQKDNKEKVNNSSREWRKNNREKTRRSVRKWKENNEEYFKRPEFKEKERIRNRKRREDPIFRLHQNLSRSMNYSLRNNNLSKNRKKWEKLVGYTTQQLKEHLEKLFKPGMSWKNYGKWHNDHIIPIDFFEFKSTDDVEFKYCWSLDNLQPLWALDNIKKSNKIIRKII